MRSIILAFTLLLLAHSPLANATAPHTGSGTWQTTGVGYAGTGTVTVTYSEYSGLDDVLAIRHHTTTLPSGASSRGTFYMYFGQDISNGGVFTDLLHGCTVVAGDFHAPATNIDAICPALRFTFHVQVTFG